MPSPSRVREIADRTANLMVVGLIDKAAHAVNFSHPVELAVTVQAWLDDDLIGGAPPPDGVRLFVVHPDGRA